MTKRMDHDFKKADLVLRLHREGIVSLSVMQSIQRLCLPGSGPGSLVQELVEEGTQLTVW